MDKLRIIAIKCKAKDLLDQLQEEEQLKYFKTEKECLHCGNKLYKSDLKDYTYVCYECEENFYEFETR